jgi:hypothetical protein
LQTESVSGPVVMICPNLKCRKVLQVPGKCRGQHVKCRYCSMTFAVPLAKVQPRLPEADNQAKDKKGKGAEKKGEKEKGD